ncbi:MAG: hypothetical protein IPK95_02785 [Cellvibrionales bacterium]|nr:hypothetical protein [Cellvibrionales bacterium]
MKPGKGFSNWIDRLVSPAYAADQEILYKARILASIVWVYVILLLLTSGYLFFLAPIPFSSAVFSSLLLLVMAVGYAHVLREMKSGKAYERCIDRVVFLRLPVWWRALPRQAGRWKRHARRFLWYRLSWRLHWVRVIAA